MGPGGYSLSEGAVAAAKHALCGSSVRPSDVDVLIYAGVCRELFEPATACRVASRVGVSSNAAIYDLSNACLGVLNGMVDIANRIELGQIRAGMVVSCETSREINDIAIDKMLKARTMDSFKDSLATLTGGSGAVAVILTDGSFTGPKRRRLVGGVTQNAPQFHALCRWGIEALGSLAPSQFHQFMATDSIAVLKHGVDLGLKTWKAFLRKVSWREDQVNTVICHQVGLTHRQTVLQALGIDQKKEYSTFAHLGEYIGHGLAPLDRRAGRGTRLPPARRPRRPARDRQRAELLDARGGVVNLPPATAPPTTPSSKSILGYDLRPQRPSTSLPR